MGRGLKDLNRSPPTNHTDLVAQKTRPYSKLFTGSNFGAKICIASSPNGYATPAITNGTM